ncbi:50S ribosomal protein L11 methyltransferase [Saprospiraceae bacterium]|nr:50S ribosomal protein L11 methyltransferase [Saprospiraceae bacterium]
MEEKEKWSKITLDFDKEIIDQELLMGWLVYYGVESIVENDDNLESYVLTSDLAAVLDGLKTNQSLSKVKITTETVEDKNWNEIWESNFEPVKIGDVGIRAEFHDPMEAKYEIIIQPKMAFGTGHHETTYMMIEYMSQQKLEGLSVLDYGCGTGILAILAHKLNAKPITAIDMQEEAVENTVEQMMLNDIPPIDIDVEQSDISFLDDTEYDVILANINRHVILGKIEEISKRLKEGGQLLVSGILKSDEKKVLSLYNSHNFTLKHSNYKGEWCLFVLEKDIIEK